MKPEDLKSGVIVDYPYLWRWQQERGETEGRKDRPVCVAIALRRLDSSKTYLALLAISGTPPQPGRRTLELAEIECRRAGIKTWKAAWIYIDEYNFDIAEWSYYLDLSQEPRGRFSKSFMMKLAAECSPFFKTRQSRVDRTD
ncbi:hypothetical protein [Inquilinus sp. CA228]|uniref:hypothetical protein n=1 Tax=Inquilinus sp. CA228 TaxID=3455609 RepID=UPI003F8D0C89